MKLSIVTINYNDSHGLKKTLDSVKSQVFGEKAKGREGECLELEHIIIDGGSTDGAVDVIKDYLLQIADCRLQIEVNWVSEPDKGIYNAMNKGIRMATGDYIQILNSGDVFASPTVIADCRLQIADLGYPEFIYGNMIKMDYAAGKVVGKSGEVPYSLLQYYAATMNHDCCWIKRTLFVGDEVKGEGLEAKGERREAKGDGRGVKGEGREAKGDGREAKGDGLEAKGDGRGVKGEGREAKGDGLEAKGERREAKGEGQEAKGDGQEAKGEGLEAKGEGREVKGDGREVKGEGQEAKGEGREAKGERQEAKGEGREVKGERQEAKGDGLEAKGERREAKGERQEAIGLYDEELKIVSDWKWFLQAIGLGKVKPVYVDVDMTIFDTSGISESNLQLRNEERRKVLEEVLPPAVLADYDKHAFDMHQMDNLRKHPWAYKLVWTLERVLNRWDNKNFKKPKNN